MSRYFKLEEKVDLKPCPFCGGEAYITGFFAPTMDGDEINSYIVGCDECDISFHQSWEYGDIVKMWNERAGK